ncbi:hypothetical protein FSHL1_006840 [Fusarium sambucinum]
MSTSKTPPDQQRESVAIDNVGDNSEEATGHDPVSNNNNDQVGTIQVQTSSQGNNDALRTSHPRQRHKPKSKRGKYISKACNECKRRKSKCNGELPCGRCVQHFHTCIYAPSHSTSQSDSSTKVIKSLSQQVAQLQDNLQELRNDRRTSPVTAVSPEEGLESTSQTSLRRPLSRHALSTAAQDDVADVTIHAHTTPPTITPSSAGQSRQPAVNYTFNLELARQHLRAQGSRAGDSESSDPANQSETILHGPSEAQESWTFNNSTIDPLWLMDKQEALRLCHVYEEEIGTSYPFLALSGLVENANKLYDAMEAGSRSGFAFASLPGPPIITADEIDILRLALSTALTIETSSSSGLGSALFAKAQERISRKAWESPSLNSISLFTLTAIHSFLSGDDLQAWRIIGIPARSCLELGLHQATTYTTMFKEPLERKMAIRMFWSVHTLDRRWSFGAGLPFLLQSNDIDSNIPWPDDEVPYLHAMVAYNRIGAKVWATLYNAGSTASNVPRDEIEYLHYSVERWYKEIPTILKLPEEGAPTIGRGHHRLQVLLYLRACQMKILLHQSALHAIPRPARDTSQVQMLVSIAKDMIQKLNHLNQTTDIYQTQQVCFNHFLVSALGVIFLAVALEPAVYRDSVRQEFNTALDLVRGFSKRSYVSRCLWKMIRGLQQAGVRLGISAPNQEGRTAQATPQATPRQTGHMPSPLVIDPARESPQTSDTWLNNGIMADGVAGFGILDGMEMTLSLDDFLTAAENDDSLWGTSLSPGIAHYEERQSFSNLDKTSSETLGKGYIQVKPGLLQKMIYHACERIIAAEPKLTEWDMVMGDGDCGEAVKGLSDSVLPFLDQEVSQTGSVLGFLRQLVMCIDDMGGTLGAIFGILISAFQASLADIAET